MDEPIIIEKIEMKAYLEAVILSESLIAQKLKDLLHNKTKSDRYLDKDVTSVISSISRYSWDQRLAPFLKEQVLDWWKRRCTLFHSKAYVLNSLDKNQKKLEELAMDGAYLNAQLNHILFTYKEPNVIRVSV
ncbi:hypothetical protein DFR65_102127 [Oceanihabitans sediminis]|uniref:Uncharacterized protein n=1 Tax=Oceanihabitans sediminis TaxID=1812012 RepID=A0A368P707_9FLAO|nr:hypothetical protein [Oceanihabitans sediminis]RBP32792.1 hypothetical protein DFR65_102127 [Oceanihabitans sediminis]RCU57675.1 hypothetical protein DU428_07745 [Oceanihabitans sediminis]